jgi:alcohol dehydrogenase
MKALTYEGPFDIQYSDVDDPTGDDLSAVIQVTAAGICGSDLHIYQGHGFSDDIGFSIGHEAVGIVVETGSQVRQFAAGERVLVPASVGCVSCAPCARGHVGNCDNRREPWKESVYGVSHRLPGCQAQSLRVPHADVNLFRVPDGVSDDAAIVLTDNAPTAWYGCRRARIAPGDTVAVIGAGPVGLMAVQSALAMGAARVLTIEPVAERRAMAESMGADLVDVDDPKQHIKDLSGGFGVDAVVEAVGADATLELAVSAARRGGRVSVVGVNQNEAFPFRMRAAQTKELEFAIGLCSAQMELPALVKLAAAGRIDPAAVVTHHRPMSEGRDAFKTLNDRADGVGKIVLDPTT